MYLSIATTHAPATDLGFLLMKHPDRAHDVELSFGRGTAFFPQADAQRCEAALILDLDPVALVRGGGEGVADQYVNDRPYAASSFLSVAPLPAPRDGDLLERLFAPLGWTVEARRIEEADGAPRYVELRLTGTLRLADALGHLYVLIPAMDADKHYWVGDDEVEKLVAKGGAWLAAHPERETIARRFLKNRRSLARAALARLAPEAENEDGPEDEKSPPREKGLEAPLRLHDRRLDAVVGMLKEAGAASPISAAEKVGCCNGWSTTAASSV
ncbi:hypothetical protein [Methylosinus sp. H3A]|uniref:hypothetical protein n=1 Tax=Methylosinus sp. H3A TaxID=2785786 RepID=UPI001FEE2C96|nr:hypothetical protein [Methylosinus sp. H3A]